MKNKNYISIALLSLSLLTANVTQAAFPVKVAPARTEATTLAPRQEAAATLTVNANSATAATSAIESKVATKKHSFISRWYNKMVTKAKAAAIPQILYIIMAIFPLGWLAMGINDNFEGTDWLLSLLLYVILYLPGLIYTLIKMDKYY